MIAFINNRDRLTWPKALAKECERLGLDPVFVDNSSTYPPLLDYYASGPYSVEIVPNLGPRAPWLSGLVDRWVKDGEPYVVTDPDLDISRVPDDALKVLDEGLSRFKVAKAGLSLEIDDIPSSSWNMPQAGPLTLGEIEGTYWLRSLGDRFFAANVDTTFALYSRGSEGWKDIGDYKDSRFYSAVRANRPYTARHLPWYQTKATLTDEDRYYIAHREHIEKLGAFCGTLA